MTSEFPQSLYEEINARGGLLDISRFRNKEKPTLVNVLSFASYWFNLWQQSSGTVWSTLRLIATNRRDCDAFVHFDGTGNFIGLHAGFLLRLSALLEKLKTDDKIKGILNLQSFDKLKIGERNGSSMLVDDCVRWVLMHEVAHIIRGHLFHLNTAGLNATLSEARTRKVRKEANIVRFFENDADAVGIDFSISLAEGSNIKRWSQAKRVARFRNLLVAVGLTMLLLDRSDLSLQRKDYVANPHPFVRLLLMLDFAGPSARREFNITLEQVYEAAKAALYIVSLAAKVMGFRNPVWYIDSPSLYRQALAIQQAEMESLKANSEIWFSGRSTLTPKDYLI